MGGRAFGMIGGADHAAEGGVRGAAPARLCLAKVEESVADTAAAIAVQKHRFAEIEGSCDVESRGGERTLPGIVLRREWRSRRGGAGVVGRAG